MNKLILVNGDLATGKSHFALILKNRYQIPLYTKDEYKEALADETSCRTIQDSHKLSLLAMEKIINIYKETATKHNDLILEANFHEEHLNQLLEIANEYGYEILNLNLVGTTTILYDRYMHRLKYEPRHKVHSFNTLNSFIKFKAYTENRRKEKLIGTVITINTDDFSYQKDASLLERIDSFINN
ncbi:MAG: hypothetical protein HUJ59_03890 [Bacilli bacterium]|nr:hypothetical protein [Bacilli bacterium]